MRAVAAMTALKRASVSSSISHDRSGLYERVIEKS